MSRTRTRRSRAGIVPFHEEIGCACAAAPALTLACAVRFNARVNCNIALSSFRVVALSLLVAGCATKEETLPPPRAVKLADSPAVVLAALPGDWTIDVVASAEVLARTQFESRRAMMVRREGLRQSAAEPMMVSERFDPKAYREARRYWAGVLAKPDMQWRLHFNPDGSGEHVAVVQTGGEAQVTPFRWQLDGWRLRVDYGAGSKLKSFEVEAPSAVELNYPMQPLGDHLVLRKRP
jgi:hypothetical protein